MLTRPHEFPLEVAAGFSNKSDTQHSGRLPELLADLASRLNRRHDRSSISHPTKLALKIALVRPRRPE